MPERRQSHGRSRRTARRFQPEGSDNGLEPRLLLTTGLRLGLSQSPVHVAPRTVHAANHAQRITPTAEINAEYAAFVSDFTLEEAAYLASLTSQSTSTTAVSAMLTAAYTPGPGSLMPVNNASVFGPNGTFTTPVIATASVGGVLVAFVLTGRSGNLLLINSAQSSQVSLNSGTVLSANVPITVANSVAVSFPSFINNRSEQMAINLVVYFNNFPIKLPTFNAPPHTPIQRGAIQLFVYQQVVGTSPTSLEESLLTIPLPTTTTGSNVTIYNSAVLAAVEQSRQRVLSGVNQIWAGKLRVAAPLPANRLGMLDNTSTTTTITNGSAVAGSTTPGTGS
jgi:hypothetical protein